MAGKDNTFIALWNGKEIGTRRSPRPYTHAIVGHSDEEGARARAYAAEGKNDRENYAYHLRVSKQQPGVPDPTPFKNVFGAMTTRDFTYTASEIQDAKEEIEGGIEGYLKRQRDERIANFEARKAKGKFDPTVLGWSMSPGNAGKAADKFRNDGYVVLGIVPAEVKAKKAA